MANIVVQANASNKQWPTVNIVASAAPKGKKGHSQVPIAQNTAHQFKIYQPTASPIAGLQTIWISGYSGPA
jgi:hypothetical protein